MAGCFLLAWAATLAGPALDHPGSSASRQPIDLLVQAGAVLDDNVLTLGYDWRASREDLALLREVPSHTDIVIRVTV